ncbi:MAG TPA: PilZ domain-containing protein [Candidatus Polarisedimenticolia bacterium]|nr:PilZ domain-containing protein [Candidatus Polarisedimenticolia bacterium]
MSHTTEKRQHPRVKDRLTLRSSFAGSGSSEMATTDLSLGGALVVAGRYIPLMTKVEVTLLLPPEPSESGPRPVHTQAVVVRVRPPEEHAGLQHYELALFFSHMEQRDRSVLSRYLAAQTPGS